MKKFGFTKGIPHQFSFECTFRSRQPPVAPWYLFHVTNYYEESQLAVTMYPEQETLGLALPDANGRLQNVFFQHKMLFDESWHKVMIGVTSQEARLWVDCKQVAGVHGDYVEPLEARGGFDTRGGHLYVSQMMKTRKDMIEETVPVCGRFEQTVYHFHFHAKAILLQKLSVASTCFFLSLSFQSSALVS